MGEEKKLPYIHVEKTFITFLNFDDFVDAREENRIRQCTECKYYFNPHTMYDEHSTLKKCISCRTKHQLKSKRMEWDRAEARRKQKEFKDAWEAGE